MPPETEREGVIPTPGTAEEMRNRPREHARLGDQTAAHPTFPAVDRGDARTKPGAVKRGGRPRARGEIADPARLGPSIFNRAPKRARPAFPVGTERREGRTASRKQA